MANLVGKCPFCYQDVSVDLTNEKMTCTACGQEIESKKALNTYVAFINALINGDVKKQESDDSFKTFDAASFQVVDGYLVKYIGQDKVIHMPEGIRGIGKHAFDNVQFDELHVASTVEIVKEQAFIKRDAYYPAKSKGVVIFPPNSVLKEIEDRAFCSDLVDAVVLPQSLTTLGDNVFIERQLICYMGSKKEFDKKFGDQYQSESFYKYDTKDSFALSRWSNQVFENYQGYSKCNGYRYVYNKDGACILSCPKQKSGQDEIEFPSDLDGNKVIMLSRSAFQQAASYNSIILPSGLLEIPDFAFNYSDAFLESFRYVFVPNTVTKIGRYGIRSQSKEFKVHFEEGTMLDTWVEYCINTSNHNDVQTRDLSYENRFVIIKITSESKNPIYLFSNYSGYLTQIGVVYSKQSFTYKYNKEKEKVIYAYHSSNIDDVLTQIPLDTRVTEVILTNKFLSNRITIKKYNF